MGWEDLVDILRDLWNVIRERESLELLLMRFLKKKEKKKRADLDKFIISDTQQATDTRCSAPTKPTKPNHWQRQSSTQQVAFISRQRQAARWKWGGEREEGWETPRCSLRLAAGSFFSHCHLLICIPEGVFWKAAQPCHPTFISPFLN